jgi:hypothetical protein
VSIRVIGFTLALVVSTPSAFGQDRPAISLAVPDPARWDAAGYAGWTGLNKSDIAPAWNAWIDAASFGASAGYYWTPHTKLEWQFATTTWGEVFVQQPFDNGLFFRIGQHRFRSDHLTGAVQYQFFENTWFHPFAGAGLEGKRESVRLELSEQRPCPPLPCIPVPLPPESLVSFRLRPFVTTGFKWYLTERGFIRSDIRFVLATERLDSVQWHTGLGVDF